MNRSRFRSLIIFIPLFLLIGTLILSCKVRVEKQESQAAKELWSEGGKAISSPTLKGVQEELTALAERINPTVVNISTEMTIKFRPEGPRGKRPKGSPQGPQMPEEEFFWKFFEDFFGPDFVPREQKRQSLGSGFVIHEDGYIITNNHVVEKSDEILVTFTEEENGKKYKAKIIGQDPKTDIALIKIDAGRKLPVAVLGDSEKVQVGSIVLAMGNPFGHGHSITMGIISATGRILPTGMFSPYTDYFQTDASINPGNSGGPLVNINGEVVGIATAIDIRAQGIGFAIPINVAKDLLPQLKEKGKVVRGWLGVGIDRLTPEIREHLKLPKDLKGVIVTEVFPGDPADKAGVEPYDVIYEFEGKPVGSQRDLVAAVGATPVGSMATMNVYRSGKKKTFNVKLGERKEEEEIGKKPTPKEEKGAANLGIYASNITPQMVELFNLQAKAGVVITEIERGSLAEIAGFAPGDVILEIDRKKISDTKDLEKATKDVKKGQSLLFYVQRGPGKSFVTVKIPKNEKEEKE